MFKSQRVQARQFREQQQRLEELKAAIGAAETALRDLTQALQRPNTPVEKKSLFWLSIGDFLGGLSLVILTVLYKNGPRWLRIAVEQIGRINEQTAGLTNLVTNVINIFSIVGGVTASIMLLVGGLRYLTSGGDAGQVDVARKTILYAIVGLIVVGLAQFVVRVVLGPVT